MTPLLIGLTGGIGSGKSIVAERFAELKVPVIDADVVSRQVVEPGQPGLDQVVQRFGLGLLDVNGMLNRRALRALIFRDPASRRALDAILHPLIRAEMERQASHLAQSLTSQAPYLVLVIPLLIESGRAHERVNRVLVVDVEEALQLERVQSRDGGSLEEARAILASQASRETRRAAADDIIENNGTVADLRQAVDALHEKYLHLARARPDEADLT